MIKAVVFDADGVIVHGERFTERFARDHGIQLKNTQPFFEGVFQDCLAGKADLKKELKKHLGEWGWAGSVDELMKFWFSEDRLDERFFPLIDGLRKKGIRCYLATNNEKYRTDYLLKEKGLGRRFDAVFSSCSVGSKKPEPEFFAHILDKLDGITKEEVLFVDDDPENTAGAERFGFPTETYGEFSRLEAALANRK